MKVVVFQGSDEDSSWSAKIMRESTELEVPKKLITASAHKAPKKVLKDIAHFEDKKIVIIAVAGKSNALGPLIAANTDFPVINCPPLGYITEDVFSSLRMPSNVPVLQF